MISTARLKKWLGNPDLIETLLKGALTVAVTVVVALFIALLAFNYPAADDFCFAAGARDLGFLGAQAWYQHWAGRYTFNATGPNNHRNQCVSQYYRLNSIRLGSPARPRNRQPGSKEPAP